MTRIERESRYWVTAQVGLKDNELFVQGVKTSWQWANRASLSVGERDGERRYAQALWNWASEWLTDKAVSRQSRHLKVWRQGLEVAIKIKGSQGRPRVEWLKPEQQILSSIALGTLGA